MFRFALTLAILILHGGCQTAPVARAPGSASVLKSVSNSVPPSSSTCLNTLIIGDSQLAWGAVGTRSNRTLPSSVAAASPSLGQKIYSYFARSGCEDHVQLYSQGSSGLAHWTEKPEVDFLQNNRMILQPGFHMVVSRVDQLTTQEKEWVRIPNVQTLMSSWRQTQRLVLELGTNDQGYSEGDIYLNYSRALNALLPVSECILVGPANIANNPHIPGTAHVRRALQRVASEKNCRFVDIYSVKPTAPDNIHLEGDSAFRAFEAFLIGMGEDPAAYLKQP